MSEPRTRAGETRRLIDGLEHWTIQDERIEFRSEAYAIRDTAGIWLIDPLPLTEESLLRFREARGVVLTGGFHQRSAWRCRQELGLPVWAPSGAPGLEERPDGEYDEAGVPEAPLRVRLTPGPVQPHAVLRWRAPRGSVVLFCGDLLMRGDEGPFSFVPDDHLDDGPAARESVRELARSACDLLCPAHGEPAGQDGLGCLREALERDESVG